jgi:hypothetical protein
MPSRKERCVPVLLNSLRKGLFSRKKRHAIRKLRHVTVETGANGNAFLARLIAGCRDRGIPYFLGGSEYPGRNRIHVKQVDAARFNRLVADLLGPDGVYATNEEIWPIQKPQGTESYDVLIEEARSDSVQPRLRYCSRIEVDFWALLENYSDEVLWYGSRPNRFYARVREETFGRLMSTASRLEDEQTGRDVYVPDFAIDIVYTWVNDQDPKWQERKQSHLPGSLSSDDRASRAHHLERYKNRDELRYSLRSVEAFAPWVRRIFIVTDDQTPEWLNAGHPKIAVVDHREIFSEKHALPSFNSSGIETQLHHIDGLAEHFLYFNDDFFLGQLCSPTDFFLANGLQKFFTSEQRANENDIDDRREEYLVADANAIALLKQDLGIVCRTTMLHVPYPSRRTVLSELEARYQQAFKASAAERFRSIRDLRPIAYMQYAFAFGTGRAVPGQITHRYIALWKPIFDQQLDQVAESRAYKTFCINDVGVSPDRAVLVDHAVANFLERYFPLKSSFEK